MTLEFPTDTVIYRSRLNAKINRSSVVECIKAFITGIGGVDFRFCLV